VKTLSGIKEREVGTGSTLELLERLRVPFVLAGLDGSIREGNRAAAELYGIEQDGLVGQPLACGALAGAELGPWIVDCVLEQGAWEVPVQVADGDGGSSWWDHQLERGRRAPVRLDRRGRPWAPRG
jgi:PAS domain-containing protein